MEHPFKINNGAARETRTPWDMVYGPVPPVINIEDFLSIKNF